jgi:hypothetical protein
MLGAIQDFTSSFNLTFIISGISFLISALLHFVLMAYMKKDRHKTPTSTSEMA